MGFSLSGLLLLSTANSFRRFFSRSRWWRGSSVFHPESSRVARMPRAEAWIRAGDFQSAGTPYRDRTFVAAFIVTQRGQGSVAWFSIAALIAIILMIRISNWAIQYRKAKAKLPAAHAEREGHACAKEGRPGGRVL